MRFGVELTRIYCTVCMSKLELDRQSGGVTECQALGDEDLANSVGVHTVTIMMVIF